MPTERESPTATDYVVTALSPVLVMLMVGSLVFFLVEVLYEGKYSGRLLYTLFFFVAGAVLIARIAIEIDASRASLYGLFLGGATYLALLSYVEYPSGWLKSFGWLVNLGLMCLIWWSAHKLTWDCTHIDERQKGAGRGLLSAAGLDAGSEASPRGDSEESATTKKPKKKKRGKYDSKLWDWIERYQKHREERRKAPHTPGVWVIYFALAALPLFGLGQSLISPDDSARRQNTFLQMVVYVGGALGLLVTTSLLGLRRYLRQRKAKMPMSLAGGWLGLGAMFIAVFLTLAAFLPRPHSEVPWFGIAQAGKADRDASKYSIRRDSAGKGEGRNGSETKAGDGKANGKNGDPGSDQASPDRKGGADSKDSKGDGKDGKKDGSEKESPGRESGGSEGSKNNDNEGTSRDSSEAHSRLQAAVQQITDKLKWLVFAIVAVLVILAVILAVLRYLAPFTNWAQRLLEAIQNWWANLWGKRVQSANADRSPGILLPQRPPPFAEFSNPFSDGTARRRDPAELVAYTFDALDSWAWDRDCGREIAETPLEFAARLGEQFPELEEVFAQFAKRYACVSYSASVPLADTKAVLEQVWEGMVHGAPVAGL